MQASLYWVCGGEGLVGYTVYGCEADIIHILGILTIKVFSFLFLLTLKADNMTTDNITLSLLPQHGHS